MSKCASSKGDFPAEFSITCGNKQGDMINKKNQSCPKRVPQSHNANKFGFAQGWCKTVITVCALRTPFDYETTEKTPLLNFGA